MADETISDDAFLGGKLLLRQLRTGHRVGHDAVLLAASVGATPGDVVVELGAGIGAAGLALAQRVGGVALTLVEIDAGSAELARFNAARNGLAARVLQADVGDIIALKEAGLADSADAVLMNPPFNDAARHRASPDAARRSAHIADEATLPRWIGAAFRILKSRGALTLIWRADGLQEVLAALAPRFGSIAVQPVHGRRGKSALRIVVRAVKGGRAPLQLHPSIVIDGADPEVERALRGEGALPMAFSASRDRPASAPR